MLIFPQELLEEEIKRTRGEQRNANQMRRERMRKEAEHAHEQTLREAESKERLKEKDPSSSGPDQHGLEGLQEQRRFEDPSDDAKCKQGGQ